MNIGNISFGSTQCIPILHRYDIYLRARVPCPVNYNPFMMYAPDPDARFNHQVFYS